MQPQENSTNPQETGGTHLGARPRLIDIWARQLRKRDRHISRCSGLGWHAYMAGPCFDTKDQAITYRDSLDRQGVTWRPQGW